MNYPTQTQGEIGGVVVGRDAGAVRWFLGTRAITKIAGSQSRGALSVLEFTCPVGFSPPPHVHRDDDELFYVLGGSLEGHCGESSWAADTGALVLLPRGVPHGFTVVGDDPARVLVVTAPARMDQLVARLGVEAEGPGLPPGPSLPDTETLLAVHRELGMELLGPPPDAAALGRAASRRGQRVP